MIAMKFTTELGTSALLAAPAIANHAKRRPARRRDSLCRNGAWIS
jgi:hypothetical protein